MVNESFHYTYILYCSIRIHYFCFHGVSLSISELIFYRIANFLSRDRKTAILFALSTVGFYEISVYNPIRIACTLVLMKSNLEAGRRAMHGFYITAACDRIEPLLAQSLCWAVFLSLHSFATKEKKSTFVRI